MKHKIVLGIPLLLQSLTCLGMMCDHDLEGITRIDITFEDETIADIVASSSKEGFSDLEEVYQNAIFKQYPDIVKLLAMADEKKRRLHEKDKCTVQFGKCDWDSPKMKIHEAKRFFENLLYYTVNAEYYIETYHGAAHSRSSYVTEVEYCQAVRDNERLRKEVARTSDEMNVLRQAANGNLDGEEERCCIII